MPKLQKIGGRRAAQFDMDRARELVDMYRTASENGGVLNPSDPLDEQVGFGARNLVIALERFAQTGTFANKVDLSRLMARFIADKAGSKHADRVQAVAEQMNVSTRTAERYLRRSRG